jgi:Raf kinase inhibitor-like YbhB/YbcL family protein
MRTTTLLLTAITFFVMSSFSSNNGIRVTSTVFTDNGIIPAKYTCEGQNVNPPLHIGNIPAGAKSLALILHDPDAPMPGGFTHWVMWNIDTKGEIAEQFKGAEQGLNGAKKHGYMGMCPPSGTHHYHFRVYALDTKLTLPATTDKAGLENAIKGHIVSEADLVGLYKKKN